MAGIGSLGKELLHKSVIPELCGVLQTSVISREEPTQFEVSFQCLAGKRPLGNELLHKSVIPELCVVLQTSVNSREEPTQFEVSFQCLADIGYLGKELLLYFTSWLSQSCVVYYRHLST